MRRPVILPATPRPSRRAPGLETSLETLADAANEAAKREAAQWFYFVTIMLTLAAIVGSTTHRVLFLEDPVKVPLLSVELPLRGFYVAAPAIFVVLHFYLLAQVRLMAAKVRAFLDAAEEAAGGRNAAFDEALNRLDGFSVAQLVVADRLGQVAPAVRAMAWVTLVVAPVILLLFFQIRFLPFHGEWITWWHRALILFDLVLVWALWPPLESGRRVRLAIQAGRGAGVVAVMFVAALTVTIPGEWLDRQGGVSGPAGEAGVGPGGGSASWLVRSLVLPDEDFVSESDAVLDEVRFTRTLRDRDLRFANLARADLRKVDLSHADLAGAQLQGARLQGAQFIGADLRSARLDHADAEGAVFFEARLHGARLDHAVLDRAALGRASVATFDSSFGAAVLTGASLRCASLRAAILIGSDLRGAILTGVDASDALLHQADLRLAVIGRDANGAASANGADLTDATLLVARRRALFGCLPGRTANPSAPAAPPVDLGPAGTADPDRQADGLVALACAAADGPHVARGILHQLAPERGSQGDARGLAERRRAILLRLGSPDCPGAAGLSRAERTRIVRETAPRR